MAAATEPAADLADERNWEGGFYELAMDVASGGDAAIGRALAALSRSAEIEGWYAHKDLEPAAQARLPLDASAFDQGHLYGRIGVPGLGRTVCGCLRIGEDQDGADWFTLYLPLGGLSRLEPRIGGFPFGADGAASSLAWREPLDAWLAGLAREVYAVTAFRLALVGFEVDDEPAWARAVEDGVPERRWVGVLAPEGDGLGYWPANR